MADYGMNVIGGGPLCVHVCVPEATTDTEAIAFAERQKPCGTENGWLIRRMGEPGLPPGRVKCEARPGYIHIMLDA